jgi:hypothetical protein
MHEAGRQAGRQAGRHPRKQHQKHLEGSQGGHILCDNLSVFNKKTNI